MFPISELIRQNVVDTAKGINRQADFFHTLTVSQDLKDIQTPRDCLCVVVTKLPEPSEDSPLQHQEYNMAFELVTFVVQSQQYESPIDQRLHLMTADLLRAFKEDYKRGGYAIDTEFQTPTLDDLEGGIAVLTFKFSVFFRTLRDDPFHQ